MTSAVPPSSPGKHRGRRLPTRIALASALVAGLGATGVVAAGTAAASVNPNPFEDIITIESIGSTTSVKSYFPEDAIDPSKTPLPTTQLLTGRGCAISATSAAGPVMSLMGTGSNVTRTPAVGVSAGAIGVAEDRSANGQSCSQVNNLGTAQSSEALTLKLLATKASLATLDVEVQKDVVVEAVLMDGNESRGTFTLYTGLATTQNWTPSDSTRVTSCKVGSTSSSPNSNASDNCRWQLSSTGKFDTIVLTARYKGQFSIEGGSDWPGGALAATGGLPTNATYFWLGDLCPADPQPLPITLTGNSVGTAITSTWERLPYNADGSPCLDAGESATQDGNVVHFVKDDRQPFAQYIFEIDWTIPAGAAEQATTVDFELNGPDGQVPLAWCPDALWNDTGSAIEGLRSMAEFTAAALPDYDFATASGPLPDNKVTQFGCTAGKLATKYNRAAKTYTYKETIYILGDIFIRRP